MTLAERIAQLRAEGTRCSTRMEAILQDAEDNHEGVLTEDQSTEYGRLESRFAEIHGSPDESGALVGGEIARLQSEQERVTRQEQRRAYLQSSAGRQVPPNATGDRNREDANGRNGAGAGGVRVEPVARDGAARANDIGGAIRAIIASQLPIGRGMSPAQIARDVHRNEHVAAELDYAQRHAQVALGYGSSGAGAEIVPPGYLPQLIELLRPRVVVRALGARTIPLIGGSFTIPRQSSGVTASYTAENADISATDPATDDVTFTRKRLTAMTAMSNELLMVSDPSANSLVRDDLVKAIATKEDATFLRATASGTSPGGLKTLMDAGNVLSAAAGASPTLAVVDAELQSLILALIAANVTLQNPGWAMAPRTWAYLASLRDGNGNKAYPEMDGGMLKGFPYRYTSQIPINLGTGTDESEIYFAEFSDCVIAEESVVQLDASNVAAYFDGSAVRAAFARNQTVVRVIAYHDFQLRHDVAAAMLDSVQWGS